MSRPAPMLRPESPSPNSSRREQEHLLLARIREGDASAFETLYRSYYRPLLVFIASLVESAAVAEEVIEDVFAEIWKRRESLVIQHAVNTYIFSAARNRALSARRREHIERKYLEETAAEIAAEFERQIVEDTAGLSSEPIDRDRIRQAVREAIDSLPSQRRAVLMLRWDQGMSYAEIAEVVGSSVVAVERQLSRTLKALKLALPAWIGELND